VPSSTPSAGPTRYASFASRTPARATTPKSVEPCYRTGMPRLSSRRPRSCRRGENRPRRSEGGAAGRWRRRPFSPTTLRRQPSIAVVAGRHQVLRRLELSGDQVPSAFLPVDRHQRARIETTTAASRSACARVARSAAVQTVGSVIAVDAVPVVLLRRTNRC
jgi:hypothetical protein